MDIKLGKYFRTFPQDKESGGAIIMRIVSNLDICSVMNFVQSGIIKLFCRLHQSEYLKDKVYKIIHVESSSLNEFTAKTYSHALSQIIEKENVSLVILSSSADAKYLGGYLAGITDSAYVSNVVELPESLNPFINSTYVKKPEVQIQYIQHASNFSYFIKTDYSNFEIDETKYSFISSFRDLQDHLHEFFNFFFKFCIC